MAGERRDHLFTQLAPQGRCIGQLQVALHLRALRTDGLPTVGPVGIHHGGTHSRDLFGGQDIGDMQQHGGFFRWIRNGR
jgi:hypothetical protein